MHAVRPTPFDLAFQEFAQSEFPGIRTALEKAGVEPRDRDAFLMVREVISLIRELRPDEGLGTGIDQLAALVHHAYLFWDPEQATVVLSSSDLEALLQTSTFGPEVDRTRTGAFYAQMPLRRVWARVVEGEPAEPLDGCFVHLADRSSLRILGVFGIYPDRPGFSVVEVSGPRPSKLLREDGSPLFSPTLPGADRAGLFSIEGGEELLELGWRIELGSESWKRVVNGTDRDLAPSSHRSDS
jgi:hypothetical protein